MAGISQVWLTEKELALLKLILPAASIAPEQEKARQHILSKVAQAEKPVQCRVCSPASRPPDEEDGSWN